MKRCHVCGRPCVHEVEPACGELPAETEPDVWTVAMRNGLYVDACHSCWMAWPDAHKIFPPIGFGRWPEDEPKASHVTLDDGLLEPLGPA